jgi:transcriptional regulator with XRE-family HTH domain
MKARMKQVIEYSGLSLNAFANAIGVSQPTLYRFINGESESLTSKQLIAINGKYPRINIHWLITGYGNMLLPDPKAQEQKSIKITALLDEVADIVKSLTQR